MSHGGVEIGSGETTDTLPLHAALRSQDYAAATQLISDGCDVHAIDANGVTPLMVAAGIDDSTAPGLTVTKIIVMLIGRGADLTARDVHGDTALHYATRNGGNVRTLDDAGADRGAWNNAGKTPLDVAIKVTKDTLEQIPPSHFRHCIRSHDVGAVRQYLERMKGVSDTQLALDRAVAIAANWNTLEIVQLLIEAGAKDLSMALSSAAMQGHVEVVEFLLDAGVDINAVDFYYGTTSFALACMRGNNEAVLELLVGRGADINFCVGMNDPPLLTATREGKVDLVRFLLKYGARVNGNTDQVPHENQEPLPIHLAAYLGHADILEALLKAGAAPALRYRNLSAVQYAALGGHMELVSRLLWQLRPASVNPRASVFDLIRGIASSATDHKTEAMVTAAGTGHYNIVAELLAGGADARGVGPTDEDGLQTAILLAAGDGNERIVQLLLDVGVNVDFMTAHNPKTPLMGAAAQRRLAMVQFLLRAGATVNYIAPDGMTAVTEAIIAGDVDIVRTLLDAGAHMHWSPVADDDEGVLGVARSAVPPEHADDLLTVASTVFGIDTSWGPHADVFRLLIERGAAVNAYYHGEMIFLSAAAWSETNAVRLLLAHGANAINTPGIRGLTALMWRIDEAPNGQTPADESTEVRDADVAYLSVLLEHGADVRAKDEDGVSVIQHAARKGIAGHLKLLLDYGAPLEDLMDLPPGDSLPPETMTLLLEYTPTRRVPKATSITVGQRTFWVMPWSPALHFYAPRAFREVARALCSLRHIAAANHPPERLNDESVTTVPPHAVACALASVWESLPNEVFELVVGALWEEDNLSRQLIEKPRSLWDESDDDGRDSLHSGDS